MRTFFCLGNRLRVPVFISRCKLIKTRNFRCVFVRRVKLGFTFRRSFECGELLHFIRISLTQSSVNHYDVVSRWYLRGSVSSIVVHGYVAVLMPDQERMFQIYTFNARKSIRQLIPCDAFQTRLSNVDRMKLVSASSSKPEPLQIRNTHSICIQFGLLIILCALKKSAQCLQICLFYLYAAVLLWKYWCISHGEVYWTPAHFGLSTCAQFPHKWIARPHSLRGILLKCINRTKTSTLPQPKKF